MDQNFDKLIVNVNAASKNKYSDKIGRIDADKYSDKIDKIDADFLKGRHL